MTKITNNVKLVETDSQFLEKVCTKVTTLSGQEWLNCPFWYRKVAEGVYEEVEFCKLPSEVRRIIS